MDIIALEQDLSAAKKRLDNAGLALAPAHKGGEWEEYGLAYDALLIAERELAAAKGEEYAVPSDFPVKWDTGALMPFLVTNDHKTFLVFYVRSYGPNWDGTYVTVQDPANAGSAPMALVEFEKCRSAKLGAPNDEVFEGHPLEGRGLEGYTSQIVQNSQWLAEIEDINKIHRMYNADRWRDAKHFVFWFHDSTFECIADSYKVEVLQKPLTDILAIAYERMI